MIPNVVWTKDLKPPEFALYSFYKRVAGDDGTCWYTQKRIAELTGLSESVICRAKNGLIKKGLVQEHKRRTESGHAVSEISVVDLWPENARWAALQFPNPPQQSEIATEVLGIAKTGYKEDPEVDIEEDKKKTTRQTTPGLAELRQRWIEESGYWSGNNPGKNEYGRLGKELKNLLGDGYSPDDILGCLSWAKGWASAQLWPSSIEKQIAKWIQDGKPGADGYVEKDRNRYIKGELADYIRH